MFSDISRIFVVFIAQRPQNNKTTLKGRLVVLVRGKGLEPSWVAPLAPKASASTNFAIRARMIDGYFTLFDGKKLAVHRRMIYGGSAQNLAVLVMLQPPAKTI